MVPYRNKWKRHHDEFFYGFDLNIAQDLGLVFWQTMSNAIILNDSMPADCLTKVVLSNHEVLYHKKKPQVAPRVILRPTLQIDQTGQGKPGAHMTTLVPRIDERYQGVPQAEPENDENRKELGLQHCAICSEPPRQGQVGGRVAKRPQQGVHAPQLESNGNYERTGERGRLRIMRIVFKSSMRVLLPKHSPRAYFLQLRDFASSISKRHRST